MIVSVIFCILCQLTEVMLLSEAEVASELQNIKTQLSTLQGQNQKLQGQNQQLTHQLSAVKQRSSKTSAYCKLLRTEICGPCICLDDYELQQRYYCDCQDLTPKRDCLAFYQAGIHINGIYKITTNNMKTMQVYCDQTTDGGGWTTFQRRADGTINFYRNWKEYKHGFGKYQNEFYLGNEYLHILTVQAIYPKGSELRIDMTDWKGQKRYAKYNSFQIGNEKTKYNMHVSGFSGNAGDSLANHNARQFSTYDQDNDDHSSHCAVAYRGAWWYGTCHNSNLNGEYRLYSDAQPGYARGVIWSTHGGYGLSLKFVEMKVRRHA